MKCPRIRKVTYSLSKKRKSTRKGKGKRTRKARGLSNAVNNSNTALLTSNTALNNTVHTDSTLMSNLPKFSGYKAQRDLLDDYRFISSKPLTSNPCVKNHGLSQNLLD